MIFPEFERGFYRIVATLFLSPIERFREEEIVLVKNSNGVWHIEGYRHPDRKTACGRVIALGTPERRVKLKDLVKEFLEHETSFCRTCVMLTLWEYVKAAQLR